MDRTVSELRSMIKLANLLLEVSRFDFDQQILSGLRTRNFIYSVHFVGKGWGTVGIEEA